MEPFKAVQIIDGWTFGILGKDDLPAVKKGGVRTVRVPAELAFGERGDGCSFGLAGNCQVPPNSPVMITFQYKGTKY
jgi:peptidylprolyl isomerase